MNTLIALAYYAITAYIAVLLVWNFIRRKKWQEEVLYLIVLMPFILRLLRLK
jgi:uncharacterized membrane protein